MFFFDIILVIGCFESGSYCQLVFQWQFEDIARNVGYMRSSFMA